ncbi:Vacuolar protein [Branchiostoma belcheri]|nr:Vacuolar protein [Branchiostoma belcheri]
MDQMSVYGMPQNGRIPEMVASQNIQADQHYALLSLHFETNPLDGKADTRVDVNAQPLQIVYDAETVNSIVDFFRPPENVHLQDLTSAAMSKFEEFREQTATGLQHMISVRKVTDVHVDLKSSYIILPQNGFYTEGQSNVVVVDLGSLRVDSVKDTLPAPLAKAKLGTVEEVMSRAYDKFDIRVQSVQVILAAKGEDWRTARQEANTKLHVIQPMGLDVLLQKCMVDNDVRMPNIKVSGNLPLIQLNMSDKKLQEILSLVQSIPLPPPPAAPQQTEVELQVPVRLAVDDSSSTNVFKVVSSLAVGKVAESESEESIYLSAEEDFHTSNSSGESEESIYLSAEEDFHTSDSSGGQTPVGVRRLPSQQSFEEGQQKTELELHFEIKEVIINISRLQNNVDMQLLRLAVQSVGAEVRKRTWDLSAHAFLGGIGLQHMLFKGTDGGPLSMISTPATGGTSAQLLSVQYTKVEKSSPDYATVYNSTEQLLKVDFSTLKVVFHRDALVNLIDFAESLKPSVEDAQHFIEIQGKWKKKKEQTDEIDIQIDARLDTLSVVLCTDEATLADVQIKVNTSLKDIVVQDPTRNSLYPKILSIVGKEVFALNIVVYNDATKGQGYSDMSVVDTSVGLQVGCIRVVFLNKFVEGLVAFGNEFQAAKDAVSEASAQATQAALESAKDFSKTSTRLALDISVNAPVIVIPQSSTNSHLQTGENTRHLSLSSHSHLQTGKNTRHLSLSSHSHLQTVIYKQVRTPGTCHCHPTVIYKQVSTPGTYHCHPTVIYKQSSTNSHLQTGKDTTHLSLSSHSHLQTVIYKQVRTPGTSHCHPTVIYKQVSTPGTYHCHPSHLQTVFYKQVRTPGTYHCHPTVIYKQSSTNRNSRHLSLSSHSHLQTVIYKQVRTPGTYHCHPTVIYKQVRTLGTYHCHPTVIYKQVRTPGTYHCHPTVIYKQSSTNRQALIADLGKLTVQNSFRISGDANKDVPAVLDSMKIDLTALKMSSLAPILSKGLSLVLKCDPTLPPLLQYMVLSLVLKCDLTLPPLLQYMVLSLVLKCDLTLPPLLQYMVLSLVLKCDLTLPPLLQYMVLSLVLKCDLTLPPLLQYMVLSLVLKCDPTLPLLLQYMVLSLVLKCNPTLPPLLQYMVLSLVLKCDPTLPPLLQYMVLSLVLKCDPILPPLLQYMVLSLVLKCDPTLPPLLQYMVLSLVLKCDPTLPPLLQYMVLSLVLECDPTLSPLLQYMVLSLVLKCDPILPPLLQYMVLSLVLKCDPTTPATYMVLSLVLKCDPTLPPLLQYMVLSLVLKCDPTLPPLLQYMVLSLVLKCDPTPPPLLQYMALSLVLKWDPTPPPLLQYMVLSLVLKCDPTLPPLLQYMVLSLVLKCDPTTPATYMVLSLVLKCDPTLPPLLQYMVLSLVLKCDPTLPPLLQYMVLSLVLKCDPTPPPLLQYMALSLVLKWDPTPPPLLQYMVLSLVLKCDPTLPPLLQGLIENDECRAEILLIEPVNLRLSITRNLAAAWYRDVPEVDISGTLEAINVRLGQDDFTMMMATLDQNLNEGKPAAVQPEPTTGGAIEMKVPGETSDTSKAEASRVAFAEVWTKLQFKFELESLSATLHTGKTDLSSASGICVRDQKTCLGSFLLNTIQVKGRLQSDNSMDTRVALVNMTLDDTRPGREHGITRMFQRASEGDNCMVSVNFVQDSKLNKKIDVDVEQIYLCVCLEYILSVADFFQRGFHKLDPNHNLCSLNQNCAYLVLYLIGLRLGSGMVLDQAWLWKSVDHPEPSLSTVLDKLRFWIQQFWIHHGSLAEVPTKPEAPQSDLELNLKMGRPEIILIADSKTKDQPALVLDTEVHFQMKITPDFQMMAGSVKDLQVVSCPFLKSKRKGNKMNILHPCFISLHSKTPQGQGMHLDITTSDLELTISPPIIRTITAITASLTPQQADENGKKTSAVPADLWCIKSLKECNFWFLQPAAIADVAAVPGLEVINLPSTGEQLLAKVPSLLVKLEASVGSRTVPMLVLEASFHSEVKDWSGKLNVTAELNMEVAYYNDSLTVWEPLLEPVEDGGTRRPWELSAEVTKNVEDDASPLTSPQGEADLEVIPSAPPTMSINVKSSDVMNIVFSKALLTLLTNMGKAFQEAVYDTSPKAHKEEMHSPFMVKNEMGCNITIQPGSTLQLVAAAMQPEGNCLRDRQILYMEARKGVERGMKKSFLAKQDNITRHTISVQVEGYHELKDVPIYKAGRRLYNVSLTENKAVMSIVCQIDASDGSKTITFRSPLQVYNEFPVAMELLYRDGSHQQVSLGTIQPRSEFSVPLTVAYRSDIYCRPVDMGYQVSSTSIPWREGLTSHQKIRSTLQCQPEKPGNPTFYTSVEAVKDDLSWVEGTDASAPCFVLHLRPTAVLHNRLPYPVYYLMQGAAEEAGLGPGLHCPLYTYSTTETIMEIQVKNYLGKEWIGKLNISNTMQELSVCTFQGYDHEGQQKYTLDLGVLASQTEGFLDLSVFCPYWMVNKTGLTLQYKASDDTAVLSHPPNQQDVVLFSFKPKSLFAKKKALLRVGSQSEWSDKFSVDTVGSSGSITCKAAKGTDTNFEIGVKIQLSNFSLTKQVIFTPHYLLVNHAECTPFWPKPKSQKLRVKLTASPPGQDITENFQFNQDNNGILLKLVNQVGGIFVDIQVSESANIISFSGYSPGAAAVLLVNHTANNLIHYTQSHQKKEQTYVLAPQQAVLYTWADPTGKKELLWNIDGNEKHNGKDKLIKDGIGEVKLSGDQKLYWVSFLDGLQRVLLFTEDLAVTTRAHEADLERVEQEINLHIHGLGVSLVNNETKTEVSYIGITSSGVIWEEKLRRRWKPLSLKKCNLLEEAYRKNQILISMGREPITGPQQLDSGLMVRTSQSQAPSSCQGANHRPPTFGREPITGPQQLDSGFQVDVSDMRMYKPNKRNVRRMFEPGIWAQVKMSSHQQALHFKVNRLQIDNQLPACVFPCVLYPIAPPKSVALDSAPKPFTELSLVMRQEEHSHVRQIKYFKALMQEYAVSVDQGFLSAIIQLFTTDQQHNPDQELEYFQEDVKVSQTSLMAMMVEGAIGEQKNFYDDLHLGPIKVHLSFSLHGGGDDKTEKTDEEEKKKAPAPGIHFKALNLLLQSVGVTLTEIQDVVFKLAFFERRNAFYSQSQLTGVIVKHYSSQAIKQMYVLVLGLDVLGNPFGLIRGLTEGVGDLFYEPYQGAIQGPEEFAEGLALGVRSLVGHAIVSRITGTVGKGLAALTMDDDYQQKRLQQMSKQPQSVQEGLARGGKGLLMGFVEGVTGVVTKPVEGAKKEGVGGFFKGMGKGLVGVVARPTGGVIDFASSTFNTSCRSRGGGTAPAPPRLIYEDGIIRPYAMREAWGNQVLQDVAKGKYAATDTYHYHAVLSTDAKEVFLITNQRVVYCSKGDIFGHWDSDWAYRFDEFREPPSLVEKGIKILAKEGRQLVKKPAFLKSPTAGKIINFTDKKFAQRPPGEPDARVNPPPLVLHEFTAPSSSLDWKDN